MNNLIVWDNMEKVRQLFAPTLTNDEMAFFVSLGKSLGANPFTREIWAVKYDRNQPAAIFCGRDFYRRVAQEQSDYEGHNVQAVYSNDLIEIESGEVKRHIPNLREPGELIGAYCILWRAGKKSFFHIVRFREYYKGFSNWKSMPETMIKKVAEAQTLRMAFQGMFRGTYDESESWIEIDGKTPEKSITEVPHTADVAISKDNAVNVKTTNQTKTETISKSLSIGEISRILDPRLRKLFNRMQLTTREIVALFTKYGTDRQDKIIEELSADERMVA